MEDGLPKYIFTNRVARIRSDVHRLAVFSVNGTPLQICHTFCNSETNAKIWSNQCQCSGVLSWQESQSPSHNCQTNSSYLHSHVLVWNQARSSYRLSFTNLLQLERILIIKSSTQRLLNILQIPASFNHCKINLSENLHLSFLKYCITEAKQGPQS